MARVEGDDDVRILGGRKARGLGAGLSGRDRVGEARGLDQAVPVDRVEGELGGRIGAVVIKRGSHQGVARRHAGGGVEPVAHALVLLGGEVDHLRGPVGERDGQLGEGDVAPLDLGRVEPERDGGTRDGGRVGLDLGPLVDDHVEGRLGDRLAAREEEGDVHAALAGARVLVDVDERERLGGGEARRGCRLVGGGLLLGRLVRRLAGRLAALVGGGVGIVGTVGRLAGRLAGRFAALGGRVAGIAGVGGPVRARGLAGLPLGGAFGPARALGFGIALGRTLNRALNRALGLGFCLELGLGHHGRRRDGLRAGLVCRRVGTPLSCGGVRRSPFGKGCGPGEHGAHNEGRAYRARQDEFGNVVFRHSALLRQVPRRRAEDVRRRVGGQAVRRSGRRGGSVDGAVRSMGRFGGTVGPWGAHSVSRSR